MIVIKLMGGLGNQMFQYATGRRLAKHLETKLFIDRSWFDSSQDVAAPRTYELNCFAFNTPFIKQEDYTLRAGDNLGIRARLQSAFKPRLNIYRESSLLFDKKVLELPDNTFLEGYWQCEKYFKDIRSVILEDFQFISESSEENQRLLRQIEQTCAVSLHVRRGDYASNQATNSFHGLMGLEYYQKAINTMTRRLKKPHFYVFSDDPEWCQLNLKISYPTTFVSHNKSGSDDMRLMSQCQHHIIANSSFSWWGAWLNSSNSKLVIAPQRWFSDSTARSDDIVPKQWVRL